MSHKRKINETTCGKKLTKSNESIHRASMNSAYRNSDCRVALQKAFINKDSIVHESSAVLYADPFSCCLLPNIIENDDFIEQLKEELNQLDFIAKNNDLYKFQQTADLKDCNAPCIKELRNLLYNDIRIWLTEVTGISLTEVVDMNGSRYEYTDLLLCHDDELEGRRIAYILYLVPPWTTEDGGTLDLFNVDEHGQPSDIVKRLVPCNNMLAFFEVSPVSFHQVAEVTSFDKTRLSINGWFHGPPLKRSEPHVESVVSLQKYIAIEDDLIFAWINPKYLGLEIQLQIRETFTADSEIELQHFLCEEKYLQLNESLGNTSISWKKTGPPNKRNYYRAVENLPNVVEDCLRLFKSDAMFLTLSNITGLALHELAAESDGDSGKGDADNDDLYHNRQDMVKNPRCYGELRRWEQGYYTMLTDLDATSAQFALDSFLFCGCSEWKTEYGGFTSYIAKGEDEELLTVTPSGNSLALVYCDKDTLRFVKHVNHRSLESTCAKKFYDFAFMYLE